MRKGSHLTEEKKREISEAKKGNKNPFFGRQHTEKTKEELSEASKGENNHNYGKHHSEETRRKMSEAKKGIKNPNFGKHLSEETRRKMSEAKKGANHPMFGVHRFGKDAPMFAKHHTEETRLKMREAHKKNWQDPDFIKKVFDGLNTKPNAQEKKVGVILQNHLPEQYAYNGDFSCGISIGGKIPDFVNVNGEKIVIEVFGPWHDEKHMRDHFDEGISWKRTEFGTKAHYSQFGYTCVVFWQEDLERKDVEAFVLSELKKYGITPEKLK